MAKFYVEYANGEVHDFSFKPSLPGTVLITRAEFLRKRPEYCRAKLLKLIAPGDTIYTMCRATSSSGMSRRISLFVVHDGQIRNIDNYTADLTGHKNNEKGGISVSGCGMDMGFYLVYGLGHALWPNGTDKPHGWRNGEPDSAGGYALKHAWL